jgi:hypothetical protein
MLVLTMLVLATPALCQQDKASNVLVERVGDTAFIQVRAPSFQALSPRQQALAYWLTLASIAIDLFTTSCRHGLQQKRRSRRSWRIGRIDPAAAGEIANCGTLGQPRQSQ